MKTKVVLFTMVCVLGLGSCTFTNKADENHNDCKHQTLIIDARPVSKLKVLLEASVQANPLAEEKNTDIVNMSRVLAYFIPAGYDNVGSLEDVQNMEDVYQDEYILKISDEKSAFEQIKSIDGPAVIEVCPAEIHEPKFKSLKMPEAVDENQLSS